MVEEGHECNCDETDCGEVVYRCWEVVDGAGFCVDVEGVDAVSSFVGVSLEFGVHLLRVSPDFTRSLDMALDIAFEIIPVRFDAGGCR